ncbi:hypothetical protein [Bradyrhizobium liaoningense]|uniref:hypothetical protein n=1 Tax=Bradyrhizobium liaoningense TaxID=43992 RepID=UPI001BAC4F36|nr:hypothetical protein [Bradyrhizobium liaoningense]MBR0908248.1 hypothetical protein [Bradyrhizobium liaoningense]
MNPTTGNFPRWTALILSQASVRFADVLIGGNGNILAGGKGPDQLVFRPEFGANILDFDVKNDHLQFDDSIFSSIRSILDHTTNTALGAVISDGNGDSVLLVGVDRPNYWHTAVTY